MPIACISHTMMLAWQPALVTALYMDLPSSHCAALVLVCRGTACTWH